MQLPYRRYPLFPEGAEQRREWAIETLVSLYLSEARDALFIQLIQLIRPDLDSNQILDSVNELHQLAWSAATSDNPLSAQFYSEYLNGFSRTAATV